MARRHPDCGPRMWLLFLKPGRTVDSGIASLAVGLDRREPFVRQTVRRGVLVRTLQRSPRSRSVLALRHPAASQSFACPASCGARSHSDPMPLSQREQGRKAAVMTPPAGRQVSPWRPQNAVAPSDPHPSVRRRNAAAVSGLRARRRSARRRRARRRSSTSRGCSTSIATCSPSGGSRKRPASFTAWV